MPDFNNIIDDFAFLDDWEERYKYIIDLGQRLPPLTDEERVEANKVRGCASQVWLVFERDGENANKIFFRGDSDAHIVKGLVALVVALYTDKTASQILAIDATAALAGLDLADHITPQRSNGLASMVKRIRHEAETL